jgi:hypothetical protein
MLLWTSGSGLALAAPLKPARADKHDAPPDETPADDGNTDWASGAVPSTSRTMDLLLEMQRKDPVPPPSPGTSPFNRAKAARPVAAQALPAGALGLDLEPSPNATTTGTGQSTAAPVLFGLKPTADIRSSTGPTVDWQATGGGAAGPSGQRVTRATGELPSWARLPAEFIGWLRQNRYTVVAAALSTLLVVWLAGAVIGRRRLGQ